MQIGKINPVEENRSRRWGRQLLLLAVASCLIASSGCYAPLRSPGICASSLPDEFRVPSRTAGADLNFALLTVPPPKDYLLGVGDKLELTIPGLHDTAEIPPLRVDVMANGKIHLPLIGSIKVGDLNLLEAQEKIVAAYDDGYLVNPHVNITLIEKSSTRVLVLGQVKNPGSHILPKYENDVGHALALAGGFSEDAANYIEVHRRSSKRNPAHPTVNVYREGGYREGGYRESRQSYRSSSFPVASSRPLPPMFVDPNSESLPSIQPPSILRINLRGHDVNHIRREDIVLAPGDTIVVPNRKHEVFYVVGRLSQTNTVRFTVGNRDRELGVGLILPRDRDIDVVTAVSMAGYIDPIDSPTTVTVQRNQEFDKPLLIHVDLIKARYDARETVIVMPGDIIYLNPDQSWWIRRTLDRIIPDLIRFPYAQLFR